MFRIERSDTHQDHFVAYLRTDSDSSGGFEDADDMTYAAEKAIAAIAGMDVVARYEGITDSGLYYIFTAISADA